MSEPNPVVQPALVEILAEWEGPAIHEPGSLFEEAQYRGVCAADKALQRVGSLS